MPHSHLDQPHTKSFMIVVAILRPCRGWKPQGLVGRLLGQTTHCDYRHCSDGVQPFSGATLLEREDALPVVLHAYDRPVLALGLVVERLRERADLDVR